MFRVELRLRFFALFVAFSFLGISSAVLAQDSKAAPADAGASAQDTQGQDQSQGADPLQRPLTEKQKKANAKSLKQELSKTYKKWLDEDVVYIISPEEKAAFKQLSNDDGTRQFH